MVKQQIQNIFHGRMLRRWFVIGGVTLMVLALLLGSLPWIVAKTSLRQAIIPQLMPEFSGTSHVGAASLGWFSPIELTGVHLADADGQTLMEGAQLSVDRTLLGLLLQGVDGATLRLLDPSINLVVLKDGSNWQRALQPLLASQSSSALPPALTLQVSGAVVRIFDARGLQTGQISEWNLSGRYRPGEEFPLAVESSASVSLPESDVLPGQVSAVMRFSPPAKPGEGGSGEVTLETSSLPIRSLAPLVTRFAPTAMVSGQLTSTATIDWNGTTAQLDGKLRGTGLTVRSARHLAGDTLALEHCDTVLQCKLDGERLQIDRCRLESDLAQIELTATLPLASDGQAAEKNLSQFENLRATGEIDLARLAAQLPSLLRIRHDAQVKSGRVKFTINSGPQGDDRRWDANLTVNSLTAIASGRPIRWQQPVSLQLAALQQANGQLKGNLKCQCDYLSIEADGSTANGTIAASGDLTRLTADLRPLIDLGGLHLAGRFDASIDFKRVLDNKLDANGQMLVQGLEVSFPGWQPLREDRMTLRLQTEATLRQGKLSSLRAATLRIDSAGDNMELTLGSPVAPTNLITGLPLEVRASGRIASWLRRMQTWFSLSEYQPQGAFDFTLSGLLGFTAVKIDAASMNIRNLQAEVAGHLIEEPSVALTASGTWDRASHQITAVNTAIRSPSFAVWTEEMNVRLAGSDAGPPGVEGELYVRGDLKKAQSWLTPRHETPKSILRGQLNGRIDLQSRDDVTSGQCRLAVQNFELYVPQNRSSGFAAAPATKVPRVQSAGWKPIWTDKELAITGRLQYAPREDRFSVENLKLASGPLQVMETSGSIEKLATTPVVDVEGRLHYDLAQIAPLLRPYLDENIVMVGNGNRPFYYRGRLPSSAESQQEAAWWVDTEAGAGFSWDFFQLYGLRAGKGELQATLKQGIVRVRPLDLPFGGGRLKTTPFLRFDNDPAVLMLSEDTELSNAVITDALCRNWLQYLAPALAEATRAEGQFSVRLKRSVVPLAVPQRSTLSGNLVIHSAQIGPGPLTEKIAALAAQIDAIIKRRPGTAGSTVLNITPQVVPFRMVEGRVEHQNFQIEIGDVVVRTSGYVGLDQSLSLVAEIPIRDKWVQRDPYLRGLKGQTLKIPIRGTLQNPRLDKQVVAWLSRQMLQGAADGLLNDALDRGLQKGLDQLFR